MMAHCSNNNYTVNNIRFYGVGYGLQGSTGPSGAQGATGAVDTDLIRNIGLNAYILDADLAGTYVGATRTVTYTITLYGNSSYYNITFSYARSSGSVPSDHSTIRTSSTIYNNIYATGPQPQYVTAHNTFSYPYLFSSVPAADTYTVTMTVSTANARGSGVGSTYSKTMSLLIGASDDMGAPTLVVPLLALPTLNDGSKLKISGIEYYTSNTILTFSARSLRLNNIYNTLPSSPPDFNYITISDSASSTPTTHNTFSLQFVASPYTAFSLSPAGQNNEYYNANSFTHILNGNNLSGSLATAVQVNYFLLNAKNARTPAAGDSRLYPASTLIGYVHSGWTTSKETDIPKDQGGRTTINGISTQTRMSIIDAATATNPTIAQLTSFNKDDLTDYDPAYNPFNQKLYASNILITLASNYILPPTASFSSGTKYLVINSVTTAPLRQITLRLGSTTTSITNVFVKWVGTNGETPWYDGSIQWDSAGGCRNGSSGFNYIWQLRLNIASDSAYTGGGNIYFNIQFTGEIQMNQIVIT